jgi:hypothetical protein
MHLPEHYHELLKAYRLFTRGGKDGLTELWLLLCHSNSGQDEAQMPGRKATTL